MIGLFAAALVLLTTTTEVSASERSPKSWLSKVSCDVIRYYVAKYDATTAATWARKNGATDAQIDTARRCLVKQQLAASRR
jgi:hypothetical protein